MHDRGKGLRVKFPILVLVVAIVPATASAFCFSFGSKTNHNSRYSSYPPVYPGVLAPVYSGYGYSPVMPAYNYGGNYYPQSLPYVSVPPEFIRK